MKQTDVRFCYRIAGHLCLACAFFISLLISKDKTLINSINKRDLLTHLLTDVGPPLRLKSWTGCLTRLAVCGVEIIRPILYQSKAALDVTFLVNSLFIQAQKLGQMVHDSGP